MAAWLSFIRPDAFRPCLTQVCHRVWPFHRI